MNFFDFDTYIFDCDGVLVDSNCVKGKAFYEIAAKYDEKIAKDFLHYHEQHGGISRFEKFKLLHTTFLPNSSLEKVEDDLMEFNCYMENFLFHTELCEGVKEVLSKLDGKNVFVSSGGREEEVRELLQMKKIDHFFHTIYGSPNSKVHHVNEIKEKVNLGKVVFIGDSSTDFEVAKYFDFSFLFVKKYSRVPGLDISSLDIAQSVYSLLEIL